MDRKTMTKFLICTFYAKSGNSDYINLVVVAAERARKSFRTNFDFLPSIVESRKAILHGELRMEKVTIYVAFLKCHSDPKFRMKQTILINIFIRPSRWWGEKK
jgi:hypothetical protein